MQKFGLKETEKRIAQAIKLGVRQGSVMSRAFFIESFTNQGFTDKHLEKWQPRKKETKRTIGKAILVSSGALRRSILVKQLTNDSFTVVSDMGLGASQDYAPVHNYGLRAGRGRGFKMPKRQFMGESAVLIKKIMDKINSNIENAFK